VKAFFDEDVMIRYTGDIIAMSPPLIVSKAQIDELVGKLGRVLAALEALEFKCDLHWSQLDAIYWHCAR
jgi:adenosylmethionine-8-amino-7-oxononanoate aminotransferase